MHTTFTISPIITQRHITSHRSLQRFIVNQALVTTSQIPGVVISSNQANMNSKCTCCRLINEESEEVMTMITLKTGMYWKAVMTWMILTILYGGSALGFICQFLYMLVCSQCRYILGIRITSSHLLKLMWRRLVITSCISIEDFLGWQFGLSH